MAEMAFLGKGQEPPEDQDWVLVEGTISGYYLTTTILAGSVRKTIRRDGPFASLGDATATAQEIADERGIADIFVKGKPNA